ncbi:hypothetical protein IAU60_001325 [Kwoniella sp. DSM 27419]
MPPLPPHANASNTVMPDGTPQQNTRALLRSLEELRDSLSLRVDQLSLAVERLRSQAGELERALDTDTNQAQRAIGDPSRTTQRAREVVAAFQNRSNPASPPASNPLILPSSSISDEISSLDRPITSAEINSLLERASQPVRTREDLWLSRAHHVEDRIRRLSQTARDLRARASYPSDPATGAPGPSGSHAAWARAQDQALEERPARVSNVVAGTGSGVNRVLSRVREDQDRLEAGLRRVANERHAQGTTGQDRTQGSDEASFSFRRTGTRGTSRGSPSRSTGLPPTNVEETARQPSPAVVRSAPTTPVLGSSGSGTASPPTVARPAAEAGVVPPRSETSSVQAQGVVVDDPLSYREDAFAPVPAAPTTAPVPRAQPPASPLRRILLSNNQAARAPDLIFNPETVPRFGPFDDYTTNRQPASNIDRVETEGMTYRGWTVTNRMGDGLSRDARIRADRSDQASVPAARPTASPDRTGQGGRHRASRASLAPRSQLTTHSPVHASNASDIEQLLHRMNTYPPDLSSDSEDEGTTIWAIDRTVDPPRRVRMPDFGHTPAGWARVYGHVLDPDRRDGVTEAMRGLTVGSERRASGSDTVYEGAGQRAQGAQRDAPEVEERDRTGGEASDTQTRPEAPKESFDSDIHLWPSFPSFM